MIKDIVKDPFFLQQKSILATKEDKWIGKDLQDTLFFHRETCLGLTANMIGEKKEVIIVSMGFIDLLMFNPRVVEKSQPYQATEICLSLKGARKARRYHQIKVDYLDINWRKKA